MEDNLSEEIVEQLENVKDGVDSVLNFNYQQLKEFPKKVLDEDSYRRVKHIYLKRNLLKEIPENISLLDNLVELYMHSNEIQQLPEGVTKLPQLQTLDVSNNQIRELPHSIGNLQSLERLVVANNKIQNLPKELGELGHLEVLDLMNNRVSILPLEVVNCISLKRLLIDRNRLKWLPRQLCRMTSLEEISACSNKLLWLPLDLGEMKSLRSIYVDNNPSLHAVPYSVYNQELGFSSCGSENEDCENFLKISIRHSDNEEKQIYLPKELSVLGDRDHTTVPSLFELSMRATYKFFRSAIAENELPRDIWSLFRDPVSCCPTCMTPIFTMGYPMVFEGQLRLYSLYRLCLCCSPRCVKLASLLIQLPLVHPDPSTLHMAVALVAPPPPPPQPEDGNDEEMLQPLPAIPYEQ